MLALLPATQPVFKRDITGAAICIGIAVDDTIHHVHRFTKEFRKDGDYWACVKRSHNSIGRAMYYTTITITLGFSMLMALLADLTLLPLLIVWLKPLGVQQQRHHT